MIAAVNSNDVSDWLDDGGKTGAGRLRVSVEDGYLLVRMGPYFAANDRPDKIDTAAIEVFMLTGLEHGVDQVLFDTTHSTHGFGINTFRVMADCHRKTGYRLRKVGVVATSKSEPLRAELGEIVVAPQAGNPEVRIFAERTEAVAWLHETGD